MGPYRVRIHESMLPPRLLRRSDSQFDERFECARGENKEIISLSPKGGKNNKVTKPMARTEHDAVGVKNGIILLRELLKGSGPLRQGPKVDVPQLVRARHRLHRLNLERRHIRKKGFPTAICASPKLATNYNNKINIKGAYEAPRVLPLGVTHVGRCDAKKLKFGYDLVGTAARRHTPVFNRFKPCEAVAGTTMASNWSPVTPSTTRSNVATPADPTNSAPMSAKGKIFIRRGLV